MFIAFEGPEGSGKSTVMELVAKHYQAGGHKVVTTREPGGTPVAEEIRHTLLSHRDTKVSSTTEFLLLNAARRDHNEYVIQPLLDRNHLVISDRYFVSTFVYQCLLGDVPEELFYAMNAAVGHRTPDVVIHLDVSSEESLRRQSDMDLDRIELMHENRQNLIDAYRIGCEKVCSHYSIRRIYLDTTFNAPGTVADSIITMLRLPFYE